MTYPLAHIIRTGKTWLNQTWGPLRRSTWILVGLIFISILWDWFTPRDVSLRDIQRSYQAYIDVQKSKLDARLQAGTFFLSDADPASAVFREPGPMHWFLLDSTGKLLGWNDHRIPFPGGNWYMKSNMGSMQLPTGSFLWTRIDGKTQKAVGFLPLQLTFPLKNEYLEPYSPLQGVSAFDFKLEKKLGTYSIGWSSTQPAFGIETSFSSTLFDQPAGVIWLRLLLIALLGFRLHHFARRLALNRPWQGFAWLVGSLLLLRLLSYVAPFPLYLRQFGLFDPTIYGTNIVLRSLGDLLLNLLLVVWIAWFLYRYVWPSLQAPRWRAPLQLFVYAVLCCGLSFFAARLIQSLITDSQISFDVLNFFTLNQYTVGGFLAAGLIALSIYLSFLLVHGWLKGIASIPFVYHLLAISVVGLIYLSTQLGSSDFVFHLGVLIWLLVFVTLMHLRFAGIPFNRLNSGELIFWLMFFSATTSLVFIRENEQKELIRLQRYAENLAARANPSGERLLNTVLTDLRNDILAPLFPRLNEESANLRIKDSLVNQNFSGYLNQFDTRLYTFDASQKALFNSDSTGFATLQSILNTQARPTSIPELFYYDVSYDQFNYIARKEVMDTAGNMLGYLFLVASPRRYNQDALYPELFLKGFERSIENASQYAYGVYYKYSLVNSHNDYPFPVQLNPADVPRTISTVLTEGSQTKVWYRPASDRLVILVRTNQTYLTAITLFSYLFFCLLILATLFELSRRLLLWRPEVFTWKSLIPTMSIRTQVQGTLIFFSFLSFVIIAVATIIFFMYQFRQTNREALGKTIRILKQEVVNELNPTTDSFPTLGQLSQRISKIAELHGVDLNLFDQSGQLLVSSLPLPYDQELLSTRMPAPAYEALVLQRANQFYNEEFIGRLGFQSIYIPLLGGQQRHAIAFLHIPYYTTEARLRRDISQFLLAIINLNAFVFLIAGLVAFFITNRITRSFSFIRKRIRELSLGQSNALIEWPRRDEIGELVQEYNRMVVKLDESAAALARSEREGAWREMARQVAHEIKNPLTPMKLSLQYLQKALAAQQDNVPELTQRVSSTIVEQIDHLSHIAGEFSQFANIGNPKPEAVELHAVLQPVISLFAMEVDVQLNWSKVDGAVWLWIDKSHLNRLFTNLIRNAIQAVPDDRSKRIHVVEYREGNAVRVEVRDNGTGIPEAEQHKIFVPNFTTKSSGTGLGLAMCQGMVEQAQGEIWFSTVEGQGTSFFVRLPIRSTDGLT
jgi:signal transduction histidine kinase